MKRAATAIIFLLTAAFIIALGTSLWFTVWQDKTGTSEPEIPGLPGALRSVPDITLSDITGRGVRVTEFVGRPLVINAWAAWCPFCVQELSDFAALQQEFGDRVAIVVINRAEAADVVKQYTEQLGISGKLIFLLDPNDSFYQAMGGFSMPETLFVNPDGTVQWHQRGPMAIEQIRQRLKEILE